MSLLVHLPLNGNLENKGLADITISGSPTFSSSGKIGNCLTNGDISITCSEISQSKIWSVCFWGKVISDLITSNWTLIMKLNDGSSNLRVEVCPSNYGDGRHCYSIVNNTGYKILNGYIQSPVGGYYDKWIHFTLTSDGSTIKKFIDGTFIGSTQYTGDGAINGIFSLNNNNKINKNDFRIYNHCLSPKEVKEISKGLILHYKLDGNEIINENLATNTFRELKDFNLPQYYFGTGNESSTFFGLNVGDTYTYSVKIKAPAGKKAKARILFYNSDSDRPSIVGNWINAGETGYSILTSTLTLTQRNYSKMLLFIDCNDGTTTTEVGQYGEIKLERGNQMTPWVPSGSAGIFYDSSGYCNHGSIMGTLTTNSDTPRYTKSTVFNNAGHIYSNVGYNLNQDKYITISCWFYLTDRTGYLGLVGNRGAQGSSNSSSPLNWYLYTHTTDGSLQLHGSAQNKSTIIPSLNTWHHVTAVIKNNVYDMYLDGEKVISNASYTWGSVTQRFVVSGYGTAERFKGRISDVRIYVTALSEDDIKELYNTSAFITNNGTTECYEFDETGTNPIVNKTGVVKVGNLYEDGVGEDIKMNLDTEQTKFGSDFITSKQFNEI